MKLNLRKAVRGMYITLLLVVVAGGAISCEPVMCEDCYDITYSDGTTEWVCVEYDCTNNYQN